MKHRNISALIRISIILTISNCLAHESSKINSSNNQMFMVRDENSNLFVAGQQSSLFQPILEQGFNDTTFPPQGWRAVIIQGVYNWELDWMPGFPPPYESIGVARYRSYLASYGSMARLMSPPIPPMNNQNLTLTFWMFHDPGYPIAPDSVKVEYSTNDTDYYRVTAFSRYYPVLGWMQHSVNLGPFNDTFYIGFLAFSGFGNNMYIDCISLMLTGLNEEKIGQTTFSTLLYPPKPNPLATPSTHILFSIAELTKVTVKIYDAEGKQIRTLVDEVMPAGMKDIVWNCQDDNNEKVAKGVYFVMLTTPDQRFTQKITLLR